jgi:1,4-alpha-glucan branching enzyme
MLSQQHISPQTPTGATLAPGGATFRVWAPQASAVYLHGRFGTQIFEELADDRLLAKDGRGYWSGFQDGARDGDRYRFWIEGAGSRGYKRDPYARELDPGARELKSANFPNCFAILRDADGFPWHDQDFETPDFSDMIVYQLHVGTFAIRKPGVCSTFLDVALKIPYLAELGINVLQPLPVDEQESNPNMGYSGADLFSPDFPYVAVDDLPFYLAKLNELYAAKGRSPIALENIQSGPGSSRRWSISAISTASPSSSTWSTTTPAASRPMVSSMTTACITWIAASTAATTTTASISPTRTAAPAGSPLRCGTTTSRNS